MPGPVQQYPRETDEFVQVAISNTATPGVPVTTGVELAVVAAGQRPGTSWQAPVVRGAQIGFVLTGLPPGFYQVWAQATDGSYEPVIDCGMFQVT